MTWRYGRTGPRRTRRADAPPTGGLPASGRTRAGGTANGRVACTTYAPAAAEGRGVLRDRNGTALRLANGLRVNSSNGARQSVGRAGGDDGVRQLGRQVTTLPGALDPTLSAGHGALPTVWRCG